MCCLPHSFLRYNFENNAILFAEYKYSILPKPNGCNLVGLCFDILAPIIQIISVAKSQKVWSPSASSDDNPIKLSVSLINDDKRIYPVGRLDYDTTGALILTNDGEFANMMMHPSNNIDKVYVAKIKGILSPSEIMQLKNGVVIDGFKTSKAKVKVKKVDKSNNTSIVELTIHEGKNHQVKKMFEAIGFEYPIPNTSNRDDFTPWPCKYAATDCARSRDNVRLYSALPVLSVWP